MPFSPSGLPTLPTCESDIQRWAAEIEAYIVAKLTTAHNEIDNIVVAPFDICAELGSLSAPACLVPAEGVDNTGFSYAEEGVTLVAGSGVLPWPGVGISSVIEDYRSGGKQFDSVDNGSWTNFVIPLSPAVAHVDYEVLWVLVPNNQGSIYACDVAIHNRTTTSFTASVLGRKSPPDSSDPKISWVLLLFAQ